MTDVTPEPSREETIARLAAEAALAAVADLPALLTELQEQITDLQQQRTEPALPAQTVQQLTELQEQITGLQQTTAAPARLLANFAQQLTDLENKYENERLARIAADAELREQLTADLKLALMERGH